VVSVQDLQLASYKHLSMLPPHLIRVPYCL
jgi:hypothetical protein